jgi:paraquat-inducible protein B
MSDAGRNGTQRNARRIGAFVLGAIVIAVLAITAIGGFRVFRTKQLAVVYFDRSVQGLAVGAPVKFKGIEIGRVERISLDFPDPASDISEFRIPVLIDIHPELLADRGVSIDIGDPAVYRRLIEHGLRAQLASSSYVTGVLYVSLDFEDAPEMATFVRDPGFPYPEIPSSTTRLEAVQANVSRIIERLSAADVPLLIDSITTMAGALYRTAETLNTSRVLETTQRTLKGVEQALSEITHLVASVDAGLAPLGAQFDSTARSVRSTLVSAEVTLADLRATTGPDGALMLRTEEALLEVTRAARRFRELVEAIDRNPSILLRGREDGPPP